MKLYFDTVTNRNTGRAVEGATVSFLDTNGDPVLTYSDNELAGAALSTTTDENGLFQRYVPDGTYTVRIVYSPVTIDIDGVEIYDDSEQEDALARAILVPEGETGNIIPSIAERAGKFLQFDADGKPVAASGTGADEGLRVDLAAGSGALLVGYDRGVTGSTSVTADAIFDQSVRAIGFGVTEDGVTDDTAAFQDFVDYLYTNPTRLVGVVTGDVYCATDITNLHDVQITGAGRIKIGSGDWWRFSSNEKNSNFSAGYNSLHIAPDGDNANSGLSTAYPVTPQGAANILAKMGTPLQGLYRVVVTEGVYTGTSNLYNVEALRGFPLYYVGPAVDPWLKSTAPIKPKAITTITSANPPVVTCNSHGYTNGQKVFIGFAARSGGAHASDGAIYTVANKTTNTFELSGINGSGWAAYTGSGILFSVNGSAPKAIFYGTGDGAGNAFTFDGNTTAFMYDLAFIGWGTRADAGDEGAVRVSGPCQWRGYNVHALYCSRGFEPRDGATGYWSTGWAYECYVGHRSIAGRYTVGTANPGSQIDAAPIIEKCTIGVDGWEMSSGHADAIDFIDCNTEIFVRKNSHCVAVYNDSVWTGAAKAGWVVEGGGFLAENLGNTWTGSYKPRIVRGAGATRLSQGTAYSWLTRFKGFPTVPTPGGAAVSLGSITVPQGEMNASFQAIRVKLAFFGTWANGSVVILLKLGSSTLYTHTLALNASARENIIDYEIYQTGFDAVRGKRVAMETISTTTTTTADVFSVAFDTSSGDQTFDVTAQVSHASDSISGIMCEIETLGW